MLFFICKEKIAGKHEHIGVIMVYRLDGPSPKVQAHPKWNQNDGRAESEARQLEAPTRDVLR